MPYRFADSLRAGSATRSATKSDTWTLLWSELFPKTQIYTNVETLNAVNMPNGINEYICVGLFCV